MSVLDCLASILQEGDAAQSDAAFCALLKLAALKSELGLGTIGGVMPDSFLLSGITHWDSSWKMSPISIGPSGWCGKSRTTSRPSSCP